MAVHGPHSRVSQFFGLNRNQNTLDFVDVPIGNDSAVFLDPSRLRAMDTPWATECNSLLQHFFETLLRCLAEDNEAFGLSMLTALSEKNEFHLGLSKGKSDGRAFGPKYAGRVWSTLQKSAARGSGLLRDLEDTILFIDGIGPDRVSDAVCNVIRGPLIKYTQAMCQYYDISLTQDVPSGPVWDATTETWEEAMIPLPMTPYGPLLLVPKIAVRHRLVYDSNNYFTHYLLPEMRIHEIQMRTGLVHLLKSTGEPRVTKKALKEKYGVTKLTIVDQSIKHPGALDQYRQSLPRRSAAISHEQLASIENIAPPNFSALLRAVTETAVGRDAASAYEDAIERLLSPLFFPALTSPTKQHQIHQGRKRIDLTYLNTASTGFFSWLHQHYPSAHIFIECKNYGREIANPELDQLTGRFSPSRGQVGLLVCRSLADAARIERSCRDTANDHRGFVMVLTDADLTELVRSLSTDGLGFGMLRTKFQNLIM